jgi:hypothetical protein
VLFGLSTLLVKFIANRTLNLSKPNFETFSSKQEETKMQYRTMLLASTLVASTVVAATTSEQASAWSTIESAQAVCVDGHVVINAVISNTEPEGAANSMDVTATVHGAMMSPAKQTVPSGKTRSFELVTELNDVLPGVVLFQLVWTDGRPGGDERKASFSAAGPCKMPAVEQPVVIYPPDPQPVDKCGTEQDGILVPPATKGYSYVKLVNGFYGGELEEGFNPYTGQVIVSIKDGYFVPAGNQTVWSFEFSDEPCPLPVPVSVDVTYECITPSSVQSERIGRITAVLNPGTNSVHNWSITVDALGVSQGHVGTDAFVIDVTHPAPGSYIWLASIGTTPTQGGNVDGTLAVHGDCSLPEVTPDVAVAQPPVPTTTAPIAPVPISTATFTLPSTA